MRWVIDAIEAGVARVEDDAGRWFELPAALLPNGVRAGDVLRVVAMRGGEQALVRLVRDPGERRRRESAALERLERLRGRDPGGDLEL